MSLELFRAVEACRELLAEGHPLARASTVAALELDVCAADVPGLPSKRTKPVPRPAHDEPKPPGRWWPAVRFLNPPPMENRSNDPL
jgi:hypothetical protein